MKRYKQLFNEETKYIDFTKSRSNIHLTGVIKGVKYLISLEWSKPDLNVDASIVHDDYDEFVYAKNSSSSGGSPAQQLSPLFVKILKIPVPLTTTTDSGLDLNYMVDTLIKKYKFTVEK